MTTVKVFDKDFNFKREICNYISLVFTRNLYKNSNVNLYLPCNVENFKSIDLEDIILIDNKRAAIVLTKQVETKNNTEMLHITALTLNCLLNRRRILFTREFYNTKLDVIIKTLVEENCINPKDKNRIFPNFILNIDSDIDYPIIAYFKTSSSKNLLEHISELCNLYEIGNEIYLDLVNKKYVFRIFKGKDLTNNLNKVVFSYNIGNVANMEYIQSNLSKKNVCYVNAGKEDLREIDSYSDNVEGFNRCEGIISNKKDKENLKSFEELGQEYLYKNKTKEAFKINIIPNKIFQFRKDYDLGDLVTISSNYCTKNLRITEVTETYENNKYSINLIVGEDLPFIFSKFTNKINSIENQIE